MLIAAGTNAMPTTADEIRPGIFRTPDARFTNLPEYNFDPSYVEIDGLRMHYIDAGNANGEVVLMLHGEPSWAFLYRKMIPPVADAGHRVIVPDLIGFGRSDKPAAIATHTYAYHVEKITKFIVALDLNNITLVSQDWGSLIGLRVAAENPDRFARIVLANGGLPVGDGRVSEAFLTWRAQATAMQQAGEMPVGRIVARNLSPEIAAAYDAPFPDGRYQAGPLAMPLLVPIAADDPATVANQAAWKVFEQWQKPFLTAFSDGDPITRGGERIFQSRIPGAQNQKHTTIIGAGHFLQEDKGTKLAEVILQFVKDNPL